MNLDPHTLELLNLELDGRLDPPQRDELRARVDADPAVARHRDQLQTVSRLLAAEAVPDLPDGFTNQVLTQALGRRSQAARRRQRRWQVGLALAASTVFAIVTLAVLDPGPVAPDRLAGTMAAAGPSVSSQPSDSGQLLRFRVPAGPAGRIHIRFVDGERIVVPLSSAQDRVDVAIRAGQFTASLERDGVVTPITISGR